MDNKKPFNCRLKQDMDTLTEQYPNSFIVRTYIENLCKTDQLGKVTRSGLHQLLNEAGFQRYS